MEQQQRVRGDQQPETEGRRDQSGQASRIIWAALVLALALAIAAGSSGCANLDVPLVSTRSSTVKTAFAAQARTDTVGTMADLANVDDPTTAAFIAGGLVGYIAAFPVTLALAPITWPLSKGVDDDDVIFAPNYVLGALVGGAVAALVFILSLPWRLLD